MDKIWWNRVPNAMALVKYISDHLLNEKNILLYCDDLIPWRNTFIQEIRETVRENNSSKGFEMIYGVSNPGKYLLEKYCKAEKRAAYRPSKGYARFFADNDDIVIHNKYFWVNTNSDEETIAWTEFVTDYYKERTKDKDSATFVLVCSSSIKPQKRKGLELINLSGFLNDYDKTVYATLLVAELEEHALVKSYLAELLANVVSFDVQLMAYIISNYKEFLSEPYITLQSVMDSLDDYNSVNMKNIDNYTHIEHFIWKSQIKILYPYIEEFRKCFVAKYRNIIKIGLPIESSYGEYVYEPEEVELGGLVFLVGTNRLDLSESEYKKLLSFKEARNILSHLGILSWGDIKDLLELN